MLCLALLTILFVVEWKNFRATTPLIDTDQWYHKAVSRLWVEHSLQRGVLRTLPQVEDLGWGRAFPEKEFLFHGLTALGYRLAGDQGVDDAAALAALAAVFLLFGVCLRYVRAPSALLLVVVLIFLTPFFTPRLFLIRPHCLAMAWFVLLVGASLMRRPLVAGLAAVGFALSYHGFFIPLVWLTLLAFFSVREKGRWHRVLVFALGGLLLGHLANPYFPLNLEMGWAHLKFALEPRLPLGMEAGGESLPLTLPVFLARFYPYLFALLLNVAGLRHAPKTERSEGALLLLATLAFWIQTILSQRASEYAVPLAVISTAWGIRYAPRRALLILGACALTQPLLYLSGYLRTPPDPRYATLTEDTWKALDQIPRGQALQTKVLNCDWGIGAYVLYARPDLRFVDLLDPRLLRRADPEHFKMLTALKAGRVADARGLIHEGFGAQYVLCERADLNRQLTLDPSFEPLFASRASDIQLFRVAEQTPSQWLRRLQKPSGDEVSNQQSPYIALQNQKGACQSLRVYPVDLSQHEGAEQVVVGGGPDIRVFLNGKILGEAHNLEHARLLRRGFRLPKPLGRNDRVSLEVCPQAKASFFGISVSFWKRRDLQTFCSALHSPACGRDLGL